MACIGDCMEMSPPPDGILFMPPPPAPLFIFPDLESRINSTVNCLVTQSCEAAQGLLNSKGINYKDRIEYVEMPRKEPEAKWNVSGIGDTWLLVLIGSSIGVLILGALLAMFLLKCREMNLFGNGDHCTLGRSVKTMEATHRECNTLSNGSSKLIHPMNTSFYTPTPNMPDNRTVWAAITPRGTEHFISETNYSSGFRNIVNYEVPEDHYETIDNLPPHNRHGGSHVAYYGYHKEYDYEDPTPLIESYQMDDIEYIGDHQYQIIGNSDMRCSSLGYVQPPYARHVQPLKKPRVSSPTRIEHPNLPPLNMRSANNTLKRNTPHYRTMDPGKLPKYGP
ncbi:hypothetical protein ABEB36_012317 [Hypothenemus hampei]|uniref:Uncharacterized protein n=1 Tax=Hypothenemus hampei TaxID=57062 RepID=A0ABD1EAU6_HYPHA